MLLGLPWNLHTTKSEDLYLKNKTNKRQAEVSGGCTERAILRLVGGPHHRQAGTDPAAAGETRGRVSLRHGLQGLQGGQGEVVHLVSDAGLGAGAVLRASALEGEGGGKADTLLLKTSHQGVLVKSPLRRR